MPQRLWARRSSILNKLRCKKGFNTLILGIFGVVAIAFFTAMSFEKQQLHLVTGDVSQDIAAALTSTASSHIYDSFAPVRDGTSGAYVYNGRRFNEIKDTTKFKELFTQLYNDTALSGGDIVKYKENREVFRVSGLRLFVSNASDGGTTSKYRAEYNLEVAQDLLWVGRTLTLREQVQTSQYSNRF